jgi:hypothetical protein
MTETGRDAGDRCLMPHNPATAVAFLDEGLVSGDVGNSRGIHSERT